MNAELSLHVHTNISDELLEGMATSQLCQGMAECLLRASLPVHWANLDA